MTADGRVRAAAALGGLAALGAVAGRLFGGASADARVALVLFGGWVAPAILLMPLARRFVARSSAYALAFFFTLSAHAILSEACRVAGFRFATYADVLTWILMAAYTATLLAAWRADRRSWRHAMAWRPRARTVSILLAVGVLVAIAAWSRGGFTVQEDAYDHIGFVRRVLDFDSMRPDGVLALPVDASGTLPSDPRKGALHPAVAWVANVAVADASVAWSMLPLVLYPAFVIAFIAFARVLLLNTRLLVACVGLFLISYGGTAFQLAHAAAYGQNLAAAWYWVLAALVLSHERETGATRTLAVALLAFGGTLAHAGVAVHAAVFGATLVVFARWLSVGYRRAAVDAVVMGAAVVAALAVRGELSAPTANVIHSHVQGVLFVGQRLFVVSPMEILRQYGMCFLGGLILLPLLCWVARGRRDARAVLALCAIPVGMAFVPPIATALFDQGSYMVSRALLNAPVFAACAIVLGWMVGYARSRGVVARVWVTAVLALWTLVFLRPALDATRADAAQRPHARDATTRELVQYVADLRNPVVLSDPATAYELSAYTSNRYVALYEQHANPRDPYALDRLQAVRDVLSPFADAQRAVEACRRYGVTHVVVSARALAATSGLVTEWDSALFPATVARLRGIGLPFHEVLTTNNYAVFECWPGSPPERAAPDPPAPPVVAGTVYTTPCSVVAPERAFEVTGVSVTPSPAAPGDSVEITLAFRRDVATPFGLPYLLHVRFDHEALASGRVYPGEKYVRRFDERRRGVATRFRADMRPGAGVFDPDLWPMGVPLYQRVGFVIPRTALPGQYHVEVRVVRDSLLPNFHARDLLYDRDHYSGTACSSLEVRAGTRP